MLQTPAKIFGYILRIIFMLHNVIFRFIIVLQYFIFRLAQLTMISVALI